MPPPPNAPLSADDAKVLEIGVAIIGNLADDGYLMASVDEIAAGAEVQLGDAVDRVAAGRVGATDDVLGVIPESDVVAYRERGVVLRPVARELLMGERLGPLHE